MMMKKTHASFIKEVQELFPNEYEILSDYRSAKEKILVKHKCGYEWEITPSNLLSGRGCPKCKSVKKYSYEEVKAICNEKGLILVSKKYVNSNHKIQFICSHHEDKGIQEATLSYILKSDGCKYCGYQISSKKQLKKISIQKLQEDYKQHGLVLLDTYKGAHAPLKCRCIHHAGEVLWISPTNLTARKTYGCKKCQFQNLSKFKQTPIFKVSEIVKQSGYIYVGVEYDEDGRTIVLYQCPKHKQYGIMKKSLDKFKLGTGCPICNSSHGEKAIENYLKQNNVYYQKEFKFDDLRGENKQFLRYDFFIPSMNLLIEYNGIQHYVYNDFFYKNIEMFYKRQKYDELKRKYAKSNGFNYLEIPYEEYSQINDILDCVCSGVKG